MRDTIVKHEYHFHFHFRSITHERHKNQFNKEINLPNKSSSNTILAASSSSWLVNKTKPGFYVTMGLGFQPAILHFYEAEITRPWLILFWFSKVSPGKVTINSKIYHNNKIAYMGCKHSPMLYIKRSMIENICLFQWTMHWAIYKFLYT